VQECLTPLSLKTNLSHNTKIKNASKNSKVDGQQLPKLAGNRTIVM